MGRRPAEDRDTFIGYEEWVSELEEAGKSSPEGLTMKEWAQRLGRANNTTADLIRRGIEAGLLEYAGRRKSTAIDGRATAIPVYRVVKQKKGRK